MRKDKLILSKAIVTLIEKYEFAREQPWINKPMSYALYYTWKEFDKKERIKVNHDDY